MRLVGLACSTRDRGLDPAGTGTEGRQPLPSPLLLRQEMGAQGGSHWPASAGTQTVAVCSDRGLGRCQEGLAQRGVSRTRARAPRALWPIGPCSLVVVSRYSCEQWHSLYCPGAVGTRLGARTLKRSHRGPSEPGSHAQQNRAARRKESRPPCVLAARRLESASCALWAGPSSSTFIPAQGSPRTPQSVGCSKSRVRRPIGALKADVGKEEDVRSSRKPVLTASHACDGRRASSLGPTGGAPPSITHSLPCQRRLTWPTPGLPCLLLMVYELSQRWDLRLSVLPITVAAER